MAVRKEDNKGNIALARDIYYISLILLSSNHLLLFVRTFGNINSTKRSFNT